MKHGWEYRKIAEVTSLVADGDWIESKDQSETGIRLIQTGNIGVGVFKAKDDKPHYISEETFARLGCTEIFEGDCLVSRLPDPIGRACIIPSSINRMITAVDCTIIRFANTIYPPFFVYYSRSKQYKSSIDNQTTGSTRKRISRKNLEKVVIPVPSIEEQKKICSLLDKMNRVIEAKKEQLKELDNLAQAIFYDMFGDPVTNEKGWNIIALNDAVHSECPISYGIVQPEEDVKGGVPIVRPIDFRENTYVKRNGLKCTSLEISNAYKRTILRGDELLFCVRGTTGTIGIATRELKGCNVTRGIVPLFFCEKVKRAFAYYVLLHPSTQQLIQEKTNGIALRQINIKDLRSLPIITPSPTLQQAFAEKVEAIERQKELINQSLREVQTLFDSRMDYWFSEEDDDFGQLDKLD